jgi:hypothetical protein
MYDNGVSNNSISIMDMYLNRKIIFRNFISYLNNNKLSIVTIYLVFIIIRIGLFFCIQDIDLITLIFFTISNY